MVEKIKQGPKGVTVTYTDKFGEQDTITADYCICTIPLSVLKNVDADFSKPFKAAMSGVAYAPVNKIGLQMKTRFWEENHHIYGGHIYNDMPGVGSITLPSTGWQGQKGVLLGYYAFGGEAAKISAKTAGRPRGLRRGGRPEDVPRIRRELRERLLVQLAPGAVQSGRLGRMERGRAQDRLSGAVPSPTAASTWPAST